LMQLRKQRTRPSVSLDEPNEHGFSRCDGIPDRAINIEASYVVRERRELLSIAVSRLKPSLRSVVDAYRQHDYTMAELAKQSGLSIPAAKSRLRRARQALESSPVMAACR
jgi:RNA polymerase sigma-70 factor (ECF subfamily)